MSTTPHDDAPGRERLSALLDGEIDAAASVAACASWTGDAGARRDWHAWHLIGDVLRSEELASDAARDVSFLLAVRQRLADEPVVLAPAPLLRPAASPRRASRWAVPSAVAAGVVLVVGTFGALRIAAPPGGPAVTVASVSSAPTAPSTEPSAQATSGRDAAQATVALTNPKMIRDAELERYLSAHKQFAGTSALGVPSAFLRSATLDTASR